MAKWQRVVLILVVFFFGEFSSSALYRGEDSEELFQTTGRQPGEIALDYRALFRPEFKILVHGAWQKARRERDMEWRTDGFDLTAEMEEGGFAAISYKNGALAGSIFTHDGDYALFMTKDGDYRYERQDTTPWECGALPGPDLTTYVTTDPHATAGDASAIYRVRPVRHPDNTYTINLAELYTAKDMARLGQLPLEVIIQNDVLVGNEINRRSGISNIRYRLNYTGLTDFVESGLGKNDLGEFRKFVLEKGLRQKYQVQLVGLWAVVSDVSGFAYRLTFPPGSEVSWINNEAWGVHLVNGTPQGGNAFILAHELGHNMGYDHNVENEILPWNVDPNRYARAYYDPERQIRDIMCYPGLFCPNCEMILYISNSDPTVTYAGRPVGNANADNARMGEISAPVITKFGAVVQNN